MSHSDDAYEHPIVHHDPKEGFDSTEPNTPAIWLFTILSIVGLVLTIVAVQGYFDQIYKDAVYERVLSAPSEQLRDLRNRDAWNLTHYMYGNLDKASGRVRMPIDKAMQTFAAEAGAGKLFYPAKATPIKKEESAAAPAATPAEAPQEVEIRMNLRRTWIFGLLALAALLLAGPLAGPLAAQHSLSKIGDTSSLPSNVRPPQLVGVGIDEHLGESADLNLTFIAENGYPVALREYFRQGRPVILNFVYYNCPMLCTLVLNGLTEAMREIPWTPGSEYEVVTISIDPRESFADAQKKKAVYMGSFDRPAPGWHFLTDHDGNAQRLAKQVGFNYKYDSRQEQYAHPAAIMVLSPQGRMARYLYGIRYRPRDLRFALAEASEGRTTMALEKILLFCYHYDPKAGAYVWFALNLMRGGGVLTVILIALFLWRMFRWERNRTRARFKEGFA